MSRSLDVSGLQARLRQFAQDRDWEQFHTPKNLAMALAGEAGELLEEFQWLTPEQSASPTDAQRGRMATELADVLIHAIRLADKLDIDLQDAIVAKLDQNAEKYPPELARGSAEKATRLGQ